MDSRRGGSRGVLGNTCGELDLGGVTRAQVLAIGLEHLVDAVVQEAEGLVRLVVHGLRFLVAPLVLHP